MSNVRQWLESLGLGQYADAFEENAVEVALLTELTDEFLQALGVSLVGHRMKLLRAVRDLAIAVPEVATGEGKIHPVPGREAERRQLTVMFADLVGSTELSQKLDPEDLREINRAYQDAAKKTIEEYGGYVARYMGDGVLAYFGFPQAHEDDPQQAVRAGSALIGAVGTLPEGVTNDQDGRLAVRVGIATGTVIVGDIVGEGASQENAVVGETANLAARLQAVAPVGCVLVAKSTRDLIGAAFQCETQDPLDLKGFGAPVHAFVVREEHLLESRFASARRAAAALMGREEEVELCLNRWSRVENGAPQVVMLCGEPGIGKSRLVDVVREQIRGRSFVLQCSPRHTTSALYPVIRHFERVQREPSPASEVNHSLSVESAAILEELIERPNAKQAMAGIDARDRKERLLERLMDYVQHTAEPEPILVAVEDVHWADPTTIELLERLIREPPQRLLLTLTFRPEFAAPWIGRPNVLLLTLNRLDARDSEILVQRVAGERQALSGPVIREIVARADGVPLFIEELTRAVIEAGEASAEDTSSVIPATLQDSLTARLDSLSLGKEVAQCGAIIGREFSRRLLERITSLSRGDLDSGLLELVESGLVTQLGTGRDALFLFRHALIQDAAYATILRPRRRSLHGKVATALEVSGNQYDVAPPEVIAHHFFYAGVVDAAASYWRNAGKLASSRSAEVEAIAHFQAGLDALNLTTDEESKPSRELELIVDMVPPLMAVRGYGSSEVKAACEHARELCRRLGARTELAKVLAAQSLCYQVGGDLTAARSTAHELLALSVEPENRSFALAAHTRLLVVEYFHGDFETAQHHLNASKQLSEQGANTANVAGFNDPIVERLTYSALTWWTIGLFDQATVAMEEALRRAEDLNRPFILAYVLAGATWFFQRMGDAARTLELAQRLLVLCRKYGFRFREAQAQILLAWAHCAQGRQGTWIRQLEAGVEACKSTGARANFSYYWAILAEQYLAVSNLVQAEEVLASALRVAQTQHEDHWTVELHRLRGDLATMKSSEGIGEAIRHYERAMELARSQKARSLELRAAVRLRLVVQEREAANRAEQRLREVYESFTQGFHSADLGEARALLSAPTPLSP